MPSVTLHDGPESFDVTVLESAEPSRVVLFAAGRGGNPERHLALLASLAVHGCTVVAPHFAMIEPIPTEGDLLLRARRLTLALGCAPPALPVAGVGHSLGGTLVLGLAGASLWMRSGNQAVIETCQRLDRLVLLAPAVDFVQAPGSLDAVRTPTLVFAGTQDTIAPPAKVALVKHAMEGRVPIALRIIEGAGHFSFMNSPPPNTTEPLADREAFLEDLAIQIAAFLEQS